MDDAQIAPDGAVPFRRHRSRICALARLPTFICDLHELHRDLVPKTKAVLRELNASGERRHSPQRRHRCDTCVDYSGGSVWFASAAFVHLRREAVRPRAADA